MSAADRIHQAVLACGELINGRGRGGLDGMHVLAPGRLPVEHHWSPDVRRDTFSISKTFVSIAVGIAEAEGLLHLDDPLLGHLDQLAPTAADGVESITVEQLLTMTSGIVYRWDDAEVDGIDDPARVVLAAPLGFEPGTGFAYRGGSSYLLSRIIHSCSGVDVRDFLVPRLFRPLGISDPHWQRCPRGFSLGAVGLSLRTEELSRLGQTLLDHGRWRGLELVPTDYVDALTTGPVDTRGHRATNADGPHPDNARYGRHVWLCARDGAWRMDGIHGQLCVILPDELACISVTAHYDGATTDVLDAIWAEVVPSLR